jgi:hypothetical protein
VRPARALAGSVLCAALLGAAALAASGARAAGESAPGQVTFVSGEATRSADGKAEKLAVGSQVFVGDVIETQGRTRLELTLRDQSVVRFGPRSKVVLGAAVFGRSVEERKVAARLLVGDVWAKVARTVGGDSRFEVQTANAVAGVRGTTFRVNARTDRSVVVKVYGGTVAVAGGGPIPRPAHQGEAPEPGGKKKRVQVAGPREVSREQWERLVGAMMQVKVAADGTPAEPEAFALASADADSFEAWNRERDDAPAEPGR